MTEEQLNMVLENEEDFSLKNQVLQYIKKRRDRVLTGKINCVPLPFPRFRSELPGVEKGTYYLISGATKAGKTQIASYLILYNTIFYAYQNPNKIKPKIFYYNLEETKEKIMMRFMCYCLNKLSSGRIRLSPKELSSTNETEPVSEETLNILESPEYSILFGLFEDIVEFCPDRNPTGVWKTLNKYAKEHGTLPQKKVTIKDGESTKEVIKYGHYVPNNPEEYVFILIDHVSLLEQERGMSKKETIDKLSEYMITLRDRYDYIPVVVQQQSTETFNLEAFKSNKIMPTVAGLADSKYTARDCNVMLGICNPYSFRMGTFLGYDTNLLNKYARFVEVVINRDGTANGVCALLFDGATCNFKELPKPEDAAKMQLVYNYVKNGLTVGTTQSAFFTAISKINFINLKKWQILQ